LASEALLIKKATNWKRLDCWQNDCWISS